MNSALENFIKLRILRSESNSPGKWFLLLDQPLFLVLANFIVRGPSSSFSEFLRSLESFRANIDGVLIGLQIYFTLIPTYIVICYLINNFWSFN